MNPSKKNGCKVFYYSLYKAESFNYDVDEINNEIGKNTD